MTAGLLLDRSRRLLRGGARAGGPALRWMLTSATAGIPVPDLAVPGRGRLVELPGRGHTYVLDLPGPGPHAPVVVLLHGIATTGALTWFGVLEALAARCRVVVLDQRWHGRGIESDAFTLDECADDTEAVLAALGIDRAVVAGYSMGGAIAQVLWHRHPDRVAGLVLCSTAARWAGNPAERVFYPVLRTANLAVRRTAHDRVRRHRAALVPLPDSDLDLTRWCLTELRSTSPWALPLVLGELGTFDSSEWIGGVDVPSAVVVTTRDRAIAPARQHQLAELIPGASMWEAPGGHAALALDHARWLPVFLGALDTVLDQTAAGARSSA